VAVETTPITAVALTPAAARVVRTLLTERNLDTTYALRVYVAGRSCSGLQYGLALDNTLAESDWVGESEGLKVVVDEISLSYLRGAVVDFVDDERGQGFVVSNPNALPACSCSSGCYN
jgi:iron-sulfur cluster assembly accessory protein